MNRYEVENQIVVVRVIGRADGGKTPHDGRYVAAWSPNTSAGVLVLASTPDLAKARRFTRKEAYCEWREVSRVEPRRPWDGRPNRPLTGITIELVGIKLVPTEVRE